MTFPFIVWVRVTYNTVTRNIFLKTPAYTISGGDMYVCLDYVFDSISQKIEICIVAMHINAKLFDLFPCLDNLMTILVFLSKICFLVSKIQSPEYRLDNNTVKLFPIVQISLHLWTIIAFLAFSCPKALLSSISFSHFGQFHTLTSLFVQNSLFLYALFHSHSKIC